jgi:hypothetical protein
MIHDPELVIQTRTAQNSDRCWKKIAYVLNRSYPLYILVSPSVEWDNYTPTSGVGKRIK